MCQLSSGPLLQLPAWPSAWGLTADFAAAAHPHGPLNNHASRPAERQRAGRLHRLLALHRLPSALLPTACPASRTLGPCRMIQNAEDEVAELAKEAAKADAMARAAKAAELGQAQQLELQRLKVRPAPVAQLVTLQTAAPVRTAPLLPSHQQLQA